MEMTTTRRSDESAGMMVPFPRFFSVLGYTVFCVVAFALLLELGSAAGFGIYHLVSRDQEIPAEYRPLMRRCRAVPHGQCGSLEEAVASGNPLYDPYPWAEEYWREQNARHAWWWETLPYQPFVGWGNRPLSGKVMNVEAHDNGIWRRTVEGQPNCEGMPPIVIWAFGGSTMFGDGSSDEYTIPSLLSVQLSKRFHRCVHIVNMGVEEYNTNQELVLLERQLQVVTRPDAVIFYDGANDAFVTLDEHDTKVHGFAHGIAERLGPRALRSNLMVTLQSTYSYKLAAALRKRASAVRRAPENGPPSDQSAEASAVLDRYESNLSLVRVLSGAFGFRAYFFWQPLIFYSVPQSSAQSPYVQAILHRSRVSSPEDQRYSTGTNQIFAEAERRARKGEFTFLGHALDHVNGLVYIDNTHIGPNGNELIATVIADEIVKDPAWRQKDPQKKAGPSQPSAQQDRRDND